MKLINALIHLDKIITDNGIIVRIMNDYCAQFYGIAFSNAVLSSTHTNLREDQILKLMLEYQVSPIGPKLTLKDMYNLGGVIVLNMAHYIDEPKYIITLAHEVAHILHNHSNLGSKTRLEREQEAWDTVWDLLPPNLFSHRYTIAEKETTGMEATRSIFGS